MSSDTKPTPAAMYRAPSEFPRLKTPTNMAEAISGMAQANAAYRAALGAASTVTKQSLMDYLR